MGGGARDSLETRLAAVQQRLGSEDRAGLRADLADPRWEVRGAALKGLARLGLPPRELVPHLADRAVGVRRLAAELLLSQGDRAGAALLAGLGDPRLAPWCAALLLRVGNGAALLSERPEAPSWWVAALALPLPAPVVVDVQAALAGSAEGERALVAALAGKDPGVLRRCAQALRVRGEAAVPALVEALRDSTRRRWAAAVLACSRAGRIALRRRRQQSCQALVEALGDDRIPVRLRLQVTKSLVICQPAAAGDALFAGLAHRSSQLAEACGRALLARRDDRAADWLIAHLARGALVSPEHLEWLGEVGATQALPVLRRIASYWRSFWLPAPTRRAAREAIRALEARVAHVPEGAISIAQRARPEPSAAAISLWQEPETPEEAATDE